MNKELESDIQSYPLVVGVDLGGIQIRAAVLCGDQRLSEVGLLIGADSTPDHVIPRICTAIQKAIDQANTKLDQIAAIGVGVPGLLDSRAGIVYFMPNLSGWDHVRLRDQIEEHFKKTIFIDNDANAAALGEYMFGAGQGSDFMVYLTISTGFGGSVIINGQVMRGTSGAAMEIGHMSIYEFGERCNCGNIGCLESIASGTAIVHRATEALRSNQSSGLHSFTRNIMATNWSVSSTHEQTGREYDDDELEWLPTIDTKTVADAADAGVPEANAIIKSAAEAIGIGLVNIIHIFNPSMIILGGSLTQIGPILMDPALNIAKKRAMKVSFDAVDIVEAKLGTYVGLIGAGALVYHNLGMSKKFPQQGPK